MGKYIYISIGGAVGAVLRQLAGGLNILGYEGAFPLNTLMINITGSFLLALFVTIVFEKIEIDPGLRIGISTGFLGAFTTFSTFCKESVWLMESGRFGLSFMYISCSVFLGIFAAFLGIVLARRFVYKSLLISPGSITTESDEEGSK